MSNETYTEMTPLVYSGIESDQLVPNQATITLTRIGNINSFADVEVHVTGGSAEQGIDFDWT